jgi:hypothetical protein
MGTAAVKVIGVSGPEHHLREHLSGTLAHVDEIKAKYPG